MFLQLKPSIEMINHPAGSARTAFVIAEEPKLPRGMKFLSRRQFTDKAVEVLEEEEAFVSGRQDLPSEGGELRACVFLFKPPTRGVRGADVLCVVVFDQRADVIDLVLLHVGVGAEHEIRGAHAADVSGVWGSRTAGDATPTTSRTVHAVIAETMAAETTVPAIHDHRPATEPTATPKAA